MIGNEGDYELVPVDQQELIAPLFVDKEEMRLDLCSTPIDRNSMCFVIDGHSIDNGADGGNIEIQRVTTFEDRVRHTL